MTDDQILIVLVLYILSVLTSILLLIVDIYISTRELFTIREVMTEFIFRWDTLTIFIIAFIPLMNLMLICKSWDNIKENIEEEERDRA